MDRRRFLGAAAAGAAALASMRSTAVSAAEPTAAKLPRWRGFNLLEKFTAGQNAPYVERDFAWLAGWGFGFVRLPLSYHCWSPPDEPRKLDEKVLKELDQAVEFGRQHGIHTNLNLHRAPGYCVNRPPEKRVLWDDEGVLDDCAWLWGHLAERYRGRPSREVSFDLLNEPGAIPEAKYVKVVKRLTEAIHAADPQRLVIADGLRWGNDPVFGLADAGVAQSTRGYQPMQVSHYHASWIDGSDTWPEPTWPLNPGVKDQFDKERLHRQQILPWQQLEQRGVGVHVGECGAFNKTPHAVVLAWFGDCLDLWRAAGWGWSMWNLRGSFGIVDSGRQDVTYEDFDGHKLDRKYLELLREKG
jgi:endoglucanase